MRWLFILLFSLTLIPHASARHGMHGANQQKQSMQNKQAGWPGRYTCEQCRAKANIPATSPTVNSASNCWKYELTIFKFDKDYKGQVQSHGPDGDLALKATVNITGDMAEFQYTEPMEPKGPKPSFAPGDNLFALQHREEDYLLRFRKMASKVDGQSVITCSRTK